MLPYGISDYKQVREKGYYYIDKTRFIHLIERQPPYLFLIRPRRFGKSLLVSMLEAYYDLREVDRFEPLFKGTYVAEHPTQERNTYYILKLDFSSIDSNNPGDSFNKYCLTKFGEFSHRYGFNIAFNGVSAVDNLNSLISFGKLNELSIYVLIDEYDNFVNELLVKDRQKYLDMVSGSEAVYKQFFKTLKTGTSGIDAPVKKIFVTGVSPLAFYDLTSGFNIGTNITTAEAFNDILGVTEEEVGSMVACYGLEDRQDMIRERIRHWYNGYRFNRDIPYTIFNTDMILYYFNTLLQTCREPEELIDVNIRSDYAKIRYLVQTDRQLNGNFSVLNELLANGKVETYGIKSSFSAFEMKDRDNFVSLLFYLGLISIEKYEKLAYYLAIPNQTVRKILGEFIQRALEEGASFDMKMNRFTSYVRELATNGSLALFDFLAEELGRNSKIRDYISGESFIKGFLAAYLSLNPYYEVNTEEERTKGFVDIYLNPITADVPFGAAIELKYIKRNELTETLLETKISEGLTQLEKYGAPAHILKILLVFHGWELVKVLDAKTGHS